MIMIVSEQDARFAWRSLRRNPAITVLIVRDLPSISLTRR